MCHMVIDTEAVSHCSLIPHVSFVRAQTASSISRKEYPGSSENNNQLGSKSRKAIKSTLSSL